MIVQNDVFHFSIVKIVALLIVIFLIRTILK